MTCTGKISKSSKYYLPKFSVTSRIQSRYSVEYSWFKIRFFFSYTGHHIKVKESSLPYYLLITGRRIVGFILFPGVKWDFFQVEVVSILIYGYTTWTLTKYIEKKLDGSCTRILWAILNKSWKQLLTKEQLYSHLPPISKTIQIRWTRHAGYC